MLDSTFRWCLPCRRCSSHSSSILTPTSITLSEYFQLHDLNNAIPLHHNTTIPPPCLPYPLPKTYHPPLYAHPTLTQSPQIHQANPPLPPGINPPNILLPPPPNPHLPRPNLQIPLHLLHPSPTGTRTTIPAPPTAWSVNDCTRVSVH